MKNKYFKWKIKELEEEKYASNGWWLSSHLVTGENIQEGQVFLCPFSMLGNAFAFSGFVALTFSTGSHGILINGFKRTMLSGGDLFIF